MVVPIHNTLVKSFHSVIGTIYIFWCAVQQQPEHSIRYCIFGLNNILIKTLRF